MESRASLEVELQRRYYSETASQYDAMHVHEGDEHYFALCVMLGAVDFLGVTSILEIGSGTGRAIGHIKKMRPDILIRGIEPVKELREIAHSKGISQSELTEGDALALQFEANQFDMVCEFGVLHHIRTPERAVAEMLRVANKAIFISDGNNFGQGSFLTRSIKQIIDMFGLWPTANLLKTRGRGYSVSEGDGLAYSYSVFMNHAQIQQQCKSIHLFNTSPAGLNLYRTASHVALVGVLR
ncbi:MAG: class I SAM-dependent methyltransferase [Gemmataceae bacterium]|nr:class I SAM-dependent methyltransferase [Gemmataceae bacterium]